MDKLGVGIIGCGAVFGVHADAVEKLEIAKLAAVADIREDAVKEAAAGTAAISSLITGSC